jgi:hypothetical protein
MAEKRPVTYPVAVNTLGTLYDLNYHAWAYCPRCFKAHSINLSSLIDAHGRDWHFIAREWPLRCSTCKGGGLEVRIGREPAATLPVAEIV